MEEETVQQKSLSEVLAEDATIRRIGGNVAVVFQEMKKLQSEVALLKETLGQTLVAQEERIAVRKLELENEREIEKIKHDKVRELESHQWERSLPLKSDTVTSITKALNALKSQDIELVKTGRNGRNGKAEGDDSVSLEDLLIAYEMPLAKLGVDIHHEIISGYDIRSGDILKTHLIHTSGEFFASYSKIKIDHAGTCSCLAQQRTSAIKYAKRHNLQCLLGQ